MNPLDKSQADPSTPVKKPYSRPQLQVYGDLRKITNNVGKHGALDGGLSSAIAHLTQVERLASVDGKISANGIEPDAPRYMPRSDADACPAHIPRMALETPWKRDINL